MMLWWDARLYQVVPGERATIQTGADILEQTGKHINADSIDIPGARNILGRMVLSAIQQQTRQALFAEILGTIPHSHLCCDFSRNVRI